MPSYRAAWLLPISQPPIRDAWIRTEHGRIVAFGPTRPGDFTAADEIDLGTFAIQAVIEKPNVDIIPKRTEPDWEETPELERHFGQELKAVPDDLMLHDEELDRAQKLETLKKADPPKEEKKK